MVYTNGVHTEQWFNYMHQRLSFSNLKLHVSSSWWATLPNIHHTLFLIQHFVDTATLYTSSLSWHHRSSSTFLHVHCKQLPYYPGCFFLSWNQQSSYSVQSTRYSPIHSTWLSCYFVRKYTTNKSQGTYNCTTHPTTFSCQPCNIFEYKFSYNLQAATQNIPLFQILQCLCKYNYIHSGSEEGGHMQIERVIQKWFKPKM